MYKERGCSYSFKGESLILSSDVKQNNREHPKSVVASAHDKLNVSFQPDYQAKKQVNAFSRLG